MAKQISIPVTDHDDNCTQYYIVEYKLSTETSYTSFQAYTSPVVISNVLGASTYNIRITRYCCNGVFSTPATVDVDTTTDSTQLATPANFTLTPDGTGSLLAEWDVVTDAEVYIIQLSESDNFATIAFQANIADPTDSYDFTGLTSSTLYYGRITATASGYANSDYAYDDATAP